MISEFSNHPATLAVNAGNDIATRIKCVLGHYDMRVYLSDREYIDVDRGSFDAVFRVAKPLSGRVECLGRVGQFCDFTATSRIYSATEHNNSAHVNVVFSSVVPLAMRAHQEASLTVQAPEPIEIGNAVVISTEATLLSKAKIGDGAVIAAGALVAGEIPSFTVAGGVPARTIKDRFSEETVERMTVVRWWDFDTVYLGNNLQRLQELAVDTKTAHVYRKPTPRLVMKLDLSNGTKVELLGCIDDGTPKAFASLPERVRNYISQVGSPGPYQWVANIWDE